MTPPAILTPRLTLNPLPASKTVWVLHPNHENIVVAQGKSGVGWKSKSKLGALCKQGEQWVQIHRVFVEDTVHMCEDEAGEWKLLGNALPPSSGKHKMVKWESRYLVGFQVPHP